MIACTMLAICKFMVNCNPLAKFEHAEMAHVHTSVCNIQFFVFRKFAIS